MRPLHLRHHIDDNLLLAIEAPVRLRPSQHRRACPEREIELPQRASVRHTRGSLTARFASYWTRARIRVLSAPHGVSLRTRAFDPVSYPATDVDAKRPGGCLQSSSQWVRLPPASLSSKRPMMLTRQRRTSPTLSSAVVVRQVCSEHGIESVWFHRGSSMAEHQAPDLGVAGSSPVHRANKATRRESVDHEARGRRTYV